MKDASNDQLACKKFTQVVYTTYLKKQTISMDKQDHTIWRGNPPRVLLTAKLDELHPLSIVAATHHQEQGAARYLPA